MRKLKILLMLPIWSLSDEWGKFKGLSNNRFHYGLASIAAYLKNEGFNVKFVDPQFYKNIYEEFRSYLLKEKFDVTGITAWTASILKAYETVRIIKGVLSQSIIVIGGVHASNFPRRTLQECKEIDYLIRGEGELPFLELCKQINRGEIKPITIPGLAYRNNNKITVNKKAEYLKPEKFVVPAYEDFYIKKYRCQPPLFINLPTYTIIASRGCPFQCSFCDANTVHGKAVRYKPVRNLVEEMFLLKEKYNAKGIWFEDSTFTMSKSWTYDLCRELIKEKYNLPWGCFTRVDRIDEELLKIMKKAGCWQIGYGFESGNQKSLDAMKKGTTVQQNIKAARMTEKLGINVYASYILAWPGENDEDVLNTIKYSIKIGASASFFNIPVPFPKTDLYRQCVKDGGLRVKNEYDWEAYENAGSATASKCIYANPKIKNIDMLGLLRKAYRMYYASPKVLLKHLATTKSLDQFMLLFKKGKVFLRMLYRK